MAGSHAVGPAADSAATSSPPCALCAVIGQLVAPRAGADDPLPRAATRPPRRPGGRRYRSAADPLHCAVNARRVPGNESVRAHGEVAPSR